VSKTKDLETAVNETEAWIDDFMLLVRWHDRNKTYRGFVASLHALRDSLPWDEAAQLATYFPPLLRGIYFEGWHPVSHSLPLTRRDEFLGRVHDALHREPGLDPELVARALFELLAKRLPESELEDVRVLTPQALHAFWPS